jgi:FkbM family methyltransferase
MRVPLSKEALKSLLHAGLKTPARERALIVAVERLPVRLQEQLRKLVPQPRSYAADESRRANRYGMSWRLHPAEYFQWHQYFGFADAVLQTLQHVVRPGDCVFDVGANIGFYSAVVARSVTDTGRVHSFEPSPQTFARLAAHVAENHLSNVICHELALGAVDQESVLNDFGGSDSGKASLRAAGAGQHVGGRAVRVRTLDQFMAGIRDPRLHVLKVDVEGYEPEMLLGAATTICRDLPLICLEWSPAWHAGREANATAAVDLLAGAGYRCFEISSRFDRHGALFRTEFRHVKNTTNLLLVPPGDESRWSTLVAR